MTENKKESIVKNDDRRKEFGKMLMDVAKYLATVGLISTLISKEPLTNLQNTAIIVSTIVIAGIATVIIPPKRGEQ